MSLIVSASQRCSAVSRGTDFKMGTAAVVGSRGESPGMGEGAPFLSIYAPPLPCAVRGGPLRYCGGQSLGVNREKMR